MGETPALDAAELLAALNRHEVDCVLIGGMAMQAYGHVRTTVDLDVIAAWTPENMTRLAGALGELGRACAALTPSCSASTSPTRSSSTTAATS